MAATISLVVTLFFLACIIAAIYWLVTAKLAPLLGEPWGRFLLIAFYVIVILILLGLLTGQIALPKLF
jgi:Ca2+/H+ antiporter